MCPRMDARDRLPDDLQRETDALRRVARGVLFEPALAEDAVQEAWLAALRAPASGPRTGGWLTEAVRRIALGMQRQEARRPRREHAAAQREAQPSAADSAARVELLRQLLDALEALEEPCGTAVRLRLVDDLPPREIAARLEVPVETVRTRIKRGIEKLRAELDARNAHRRGEFLAALAPYCSSKTILGGLMSAQAKLAAAAVLLLVAGLFWSHPWTASAPEAHSPSSVAEPLALTASVEPAPAKDLAASVPTSTPSATDRRAAGAAEASWILRGRATKDRSQAFPGAECELDLVAGYDGPGEVLHSATLHAAQDGSFTLALPPPAGALRVRTRGKMQGYLAFRGETLVLRGAPAPTNLSVSFYTLDLVLAGRVLDTQGAPIAGAHVSGAGSGSVETDAQGRFEVPGASLLARTQLDAWAEGYEEARTSLGSAAPGRVEGLELRLAPCAVLHGRVVDENGRAVADARVHCFPLSHAETRSARDGQFTLGGLPTRATWISIGAECAGYANARVELQDAKLPAEGLLLTLARGVELTGVVLAEDGTPLPGAEVFSGPSRYDIDCVSTVAGDEGRFRLAGVPRTAREVHAEQAGFAPAAAAFAIAGGANPPPLRLELTRGLGVSGTVVDEGGSPLAAVDVYVRRGSEYIEGLRARSDAQGAFALRGLPAVADLELELLQTGFARLCAPLDPARLADLKLVLVRAAGFAGRVVDAATGAPVTAFRVRFVHGELEPGEQPLSGYESSWGEEGHEFHDAEGRWNTRGADLAVGLIGAIEIRAPGYGRAIVARAETRKDPEAAPIEVRLSPAARLQGRVLDKLHGTPIAAARVHRFTPRESRGPWIESESGAAADTSTDASGAFAFDGLALEPLCLAIEAPGFAPRVDGPIEIRAANDLRQIELVGGATLRGILRDAAGKALAHEPVSVSANGGALGPHYRSWDLETDGEGRFELVDLAAAEYSAARMLRHERGGVCDLTQSLSIAEPRVYEIELRPRGDGRLSGTLVVSGEPAEIVTIDANREGALPGETAWRAAIAREGKFELEGLEPGRWRVFAREAGSPRTARVGSAEVQLDAHGKATLTIELRGP